VIFTLCFIVALNLTPHRAWPAYILYLSLIICVVLLARVSLIFMLKRAMLVLPLILAAFPLIFSGPGPRNTLLLFNGLQIPYSPEGLSRFASILIKSWISIQAAILLTATTHFSDLLVAFRQLKMPARFVEIIGLMWRYLFVIREETTRMLRAQASRSTALSERRHSGGTLFWRAKVTGGMAGSLFLRSLERSDRVYQAMLSRGYNGEPPVLRLNSLTRKDRIMLTSGAVILVLVWIIGLLFGG